MKTLISIGNREFNGRQFVHGEEIPPGFMPTEAIDWAIDHKQIAEVDRLSLYSFFEPFVPQPKEKT